MDQLFNQTFEEIADEFESDYSSINEVNEVVSELTKAEQRLNGRGGSVAGRQYIERNRITAAELLDNDYFIDGATFESKFRRRFRMQKGLLLKIIEDIKNHDSYFVQKRNAAGTLGLSTNQKVSAALRQLAYGMPGDSVDEYLRIGESTTLECLHRFTSSVLDVYGEKYLRSPTEEDLKRLLDVGEARGFPGMIGSIDCTHQVWKNCPTGHHGQYSGKGGKPTLVLEAVASYDLWIWHAFFGMPGALNDINVLSRSPLFDEVMNGKAPNVKYTVNGRQYDMCYYLADGIYPEYATFVKTLPYPDTPKKKHFAKMQEAARKDVERAFGVLKARFAIVCLAARGWDADKIGCIMKACIILHNMIVEDERDLHLDTTFDINPSGGQIPAEVEAASVGEHRSISKILEKRMKIRSDQLHTQLRNDLIEHLWERK